MIDPVVQLGAESTGPFPLAPDLQIADPPAFYRPRHPEKTALYQLFENHSDSYVQAYVERFEPQYGPLRAVVVRSVEQFLARGRRGLMDKCALERAPAEEGAVPDAGNHSPLLPFTSLR